MVFFASGCPCTSRASFSYSPSSSAKYSSKKKLLWNLTQCVFAKQAQNKQVPFSSCHSHSTSCPTAMLPDIRYTSHRHLFDLTGFCLSIISMSIALPMLFTGCQIGCSENATTKKPNEFASQSIFDARPFTALFFDFDSIAVFRLLANGGDWQRRAVSNLLNNARPQPANKRKVNFYSFCRVYSGH